MIRVLAKLALAAVLVACAAAPASAFGQNKISYQDFDWHVYKSTHFDVHYYPEMEPFLEEIVSYAESAYLKLSRELDHEVKVRIPLIVYKTHGEFEQTNVTLAELPAGVAAFAEPVQYRMVLPIDMPADKLYELIAHELTHIFEYSLFFEGYLGRALRARPPTWIMEGLASYMADDEDNIDRMAIRDAVVNGILPSIQQLNVVTFLTYRYGHAIFDYIEQEHGIEGLRSFLFEFKKVLLTGNLAKAIKESFGYDIDEFNRRFNRYLRKKYFPVLLEKKSPDEYGAEVGIRRPGVMTFSPTISPSGELIAALSAPKMELDLVVLSAEDGSMLKNLTKGWTNEYRTLVADAFEGKRDLSWSPTEDRVVVFARKENRWPLMIFNAVNGKLVQQVPIGEIVEAASPAFSPDGKKIAFEGNLAGIVDIFEIDLETRAIRNLTQDDFYDANPWYAADGKSLLYNRRIGEHWKIFSVDASDPSRKTQLTYGPSSDVQPAYSPQQDRVYFSSDRGAYGVYNIYELDLATGELAQYTDVVGGCFSPQEMAERDGERFLVFQAYFEGAFRLYRMPLRDPELRIDVTERLSPDQEVSPFESALDLDVDEEDKSKYKVKWDIEAPSVTVGVTADGTFFGNGAIGFTDLLGNHRAVVTAATVADFASLSGTYFNLKNRYTWGGTVFDTSSFILVQEPGGSIDRRTETKFTGVNAFYRYPLNRYYRINTSGGANKQSQLIPFRNPVSGFTEFRRVEDTFGSLSVSLSGDTTRYQSFGPFQGKRFNVGINWGPHISGDTDQDYLAYQLDFRAYKQATRRSLLAWRLAGTINAGEYQASYGLGGLNQLRGWDFRFFNGSSIAWSNLEFRFPLVDLMRFPILSLVQIRGFVFLDVGAAWYDNNLFYDPVLGGFRSSVPFKFWDSENGRLQDGRASWGTGFHFIFLGGLQFNWAFTRTLAYTQYLPNADFTALVPTEVNAGDTRSEFYIAFDW